MGLGFIRLALQPLLGALMTLLYSVNTTFSLFNTKTSKISHFIAIDFHVQILQTTVSGAGRDKTSPRPYVPLFPRRLRHISAPFGATRAFPRSCRYGQEISTIATAWRAAHCTQSSLSTEFTIDHALRLYPSACHTLLNPLS